MPVNEIPVNEPLLNGREKEFLCKCIDTGWISSDGPFVREFEERFASYIGRGYGIAVCNGTAALETAFYATGIEEGDQVIMPTFTIISCAMAAMRLGAKPVLVDIEPETWCMDVRQLESKVDAEMKNGNEGLKAIMPVHIYGHPVDMDPVVKVAQRYGLRIIEDAAEVHGAEYLSRLLPEDKPDTVTNISNSNISSMEDRNKERETCGTWKKCASMGHAAAFSFYANKIITTGEGGMVVTNDPLMAERARSYRNLSFRPDKRFYHTEPGYNFRMTSLQAAIGLAQLERIEEFITIKRHLGAYYRERLAAVPGVRFQAEKPWARPVYWMYAIELDPELGIDAETVRVRLKENNIGTRPFFLGLHAQPVLRQMGLHPDESSYPNADRAYKYGLYLPSGLTMTEEKVDVVCTALATVLNQR
ncbi:MAG: DegT/DnrJ/EryC1/StrS family aminotransferase [bacterium]